MLLYCYSGDLLDCTGMVGLGRQKLVCYQPISTQSIYLIYSHWSDDIIKSTTTEDIAKNPKKHPAFIYQNTIVELLQQAVPFVPFQFPSISSQESAIDLVSKYHVEFKNELNRIGYLVEHTFHFIGKSTLSNRAEMPEVLKNVQGKGAAFLKKKFEKKRKDLERDSEISLIMKSLNSCLSNTIVDSRTSSKSGQITVHLLVNPNQAELVSSLEKIRSELNDYKVYHFGPLPPFHFVDLQIVN